MKEIPLTQGKVAIVDDDMYEYLNQWKWCFCGGYASRADKVAGANEKKTKTTTMYMHRQIMNTPPDMETDHINGDKLDNRKRNLRICTVSQNQANRTKPRSNTSGYKGVSWNKTLQGFTAYIRVDGKRMRLGIFETPQQAALAYDTAAKENFGDFAKINFNK